MPSLFDLPLLGIQRTGSVWNRLRPEALNAALVTTLICLFGGPMASAPAAAQDAVDAKISWQPVYLYAVPFHCGGSEETFQEGVTTGIQATLVQVYNPSPEKKVRFRKQVSRALPFQRAGTVSDHVVDEVHPGDALAMECDEIRMRLPASMTEQFRTGYLVLQTSAPLRVSATYTARPSAGGVSTIDVEIIEGVKLKQEAKPEPKRADLIIREIDMKGLRYDCVSGRNDCVTAVDVTVENVGAAAAGPFQIEALFDPNQSVKVVEHVQQGLAAGTSTTLTMTTPMSPICFDPVCEICATADIGRSVAESDETNNELCDSRQ